MREWLEDAWDIIRQILGVIGVLIGFFVAVVVFASLVMLAGKLVFWMFGLV